MSVSLPSVVRLFSKPHYLVTVAASLMLAACSESFDRFAENPSDADPVYTASVPKPKALAPADDSITSRPLAGSSIYKPGGTYTYNSGSNTPVYQASKTTRLTQIEAPDEADAGTGGSVIVGQGMTLYSIAKSNNLPVAALAAANGLKAPYAVHTGQILRIPGTSDAVTPAPRITAASTQPQSPRISAAGTHEVAPGDTLFALGRKYGVSPYAIADLNGLPHNTTLKLGQQVKIPADGARSVAANTISKTKAPPAAEVVADAQAAPAVEPTLKAQEKLAAEGQITAAETPAVADAAPVAPVEAGLTNMRWPVRGKIISSFGAKPNGLKNEGINIAVPEGTSIRAAESGIVAYSGNELKGYGNLVLIRHEGGYVTAYAHAKELFVKRGDTVKRGDVIAKAGQTGSVSSPQLHFEVRKGATAMDPVKFLSSSTASN